MPIPTASTPALIDKDGTYFSTKLITTGIVYNTKAPFVPASWSDLTKPEAKNLVSMPSPLTSGAAMIHTVTLTGNLPQGWDYYAELAKNGAQAAGGNGDVLKACQRRRQALRHDRRLHADPRKGQGRAGRVRIPEGGRFCRHRAGGHPLHGKEPRGGQGVRRFPPIGRGPEARGQAGLYPGASPMLACRPAIRTVPRSRSSATMPPRRLPTIRPTRKNSAKSWGSRATLDCRPNPSATAQTARIHRCAACWRLIWRRLWRNCPALEPCRSRRHLSAQPAAGAAPAARGHCSRRRNRYRRSSQAVSPAPSAIRATLNTLDTAFFGAVLALVIGAPFAVAVAMTDLPGRRTLGFLLLLPLMIAPQVMALSWLHLFGPSSTLLGAFGLRHRPARPIRCSAAMASSCFMPSSMRPSSSSRCGQGCRAYRGIWWRRRARRVRHRLACC